MSNLRQGPGAQTIILHVTPSSGLASLASVTAVVLRIGYHGTHIDWSLVITAQSASALTAEKIPTEAEKAAIGEGSRGCIALLTSGGITYATEPMTLQVDPEI